MANETKNTSTINATPVDNGKTYVGHVPVNEETEKMLSLMFSAQADIENPSKFVRAFLYDAVKARVLYVCNANINSWERAIDKQGKLHPTMTREQVIADMLASRKAKEMKELSDKSRLLKDSLEA